MRFAIAHDYLTQRGGAERVVLALTRAFVDAPVYTSVYAADRTFPDFQDVDVRTSVLQSVPALRRDPRLALPLLAAAWNRMRVHDADVVIASSSGWAHAVPVPEDCIKVVYCHNPARWLYQARDYVTHHHKKFALGLLRKSLVRWDHQAAHTADIYLANSWAVAERIERCYGITAEVLHPPVSIDTDGEQEPVEGLEPGFWLTVARGRTYKNVRAVVDGVRSLGDGQLAVVGTPEPDDESSAHTRWLGVVTDAQLRWLYANARALISVSHEDFGLTPLEANAFGTPVAVLRAGGFLDSLAEGTSGVWVEQPTAEAVRDSLRGFPTLDREAVRTHARTFDQLAFVERLRQVVAGVAASRTVHAPAGVVDVRQRERSHHEEVRLLGDEVSRPALHM